MRMGSEEGSTMRNFVLYTVYETQSGRINLVTMEECGSAFKILTGKPTGKRALDRPRRRGKANI